jgi:hypothetical protein
MQPNANDMHPVLQERYDRFQQAMEDAGIPFTLTCVLRTRAEQTALYAQGRNSLFEVNTLRKLAGMSPLSAAENGYKVTWTMNSRHFAEPRTGKSRAFDIAILKGDRTATWDKKWDGDHDQIPDYEEAARIGEAVGLEPGARWSNQDWPHYQLPADVP